ncbi:MAG: energy transducer TonB [bacterium]|nr:MAG: energy transducer TonB [bacterium]
MSKNKKYSPRDQYQVILEKSTILALVLVIILFVLFPKIRVGKPIKVEGIGTVLTVEDIPITRQGTPRKPPPRPVVPIPSEDDLIPDDVTIEDTELTYESFSLSSGSGVPLGQINIFQPRPIFEVIPEYSEDLQKKGIEGVVKLHLHIDRTGRVINVVVLENTTGSSVCANAAKEAAMKGRYIPAKKDGKPTDLWISRTYTFGLQK